MHYTELLHRSLKKDFLSAEEGLFLYQNAPTAELMWVGNKLRQMAVPSQKVTWIIDRNANTTNVCVANCKFCNFYRPPGHKEVYITSIEEYKIKMQPVVGSVVEKQLSINTRKNDLELLNEANFFIREMKRTGQINRLKEKYFNNNAWVR